MIASHVSGQIADTLDFVPDQQINEVVVIAKLPAVEIQADKITFRPEASLTQSQGNVFDLLGALPGVRIQSDGTIYLNGQAGALILIDGKPTYLTGQDLVTLLKSTPAATTDKIDLITHPSARYEAAGSPGLIDIRTKKIKLRGMNLSFQAGYLQGKKAEGNTALSLNIRKEKFNFFLTTSYSLANDYNQLRVNRLFLPTAYRPDEELCLNQKSLKEWQYRSAYFRTGFDYYLSEKTTLGLSIHANFSDNTETAAINDFFSRRALQPDSSLHTNRRMEESRRNFSAGLTFDHRFEAEESRLSASFDYLGYRYDKQQDIRSLLRTLGPPQAETSENTPPLPALPASADTLKGDMGGHIHLYAGQADLDLPLAEYWKLGVGAKTSYVQIDNGVVYSQARAGQWIPRQSLSSRFAYAEHIHTGYLSLHAELGPCRIEAGLRLENTRISGRESSPSLPRDSSFTNRYTHLFPTLSIQYALGNGNALSLAYGRRINRPNYGDLNPFLYIHDEYTYEQGNTLLRPELSDRLEALFIYGDIGKAGLFFSYTQDAIVNSFIEKEAHRVLVTPRNYAHALAVGPRLATAALPLAPWWEANLNASLWFASYRLPSNYPTSNNRQLTFSCSLTQQFRWGQSWTLELSAHYNGRMIAGPLAQHPLGEVNIGIEKKVLRGRGSIRLFGRDLFHTYRLKRDIPTPSQQAHTWERQNRSVAGISFTYRLSRGTEAKNSRPNSGTDESKRINL